MRTKIKIIRISYIDSENLERLLNSCAKEGWHLKKVNPFYLTFTYDPTCTQSYSIVIDETMLGFASEAAIEERNNLIMFMEDFDYRLFKKFGIFKIYVSDNPVPLYTERQLEQDRIDRITKKSLRMTLLNAVVGLFVISSFIYSRHEGLFPYEFYVSGFRQAIILLWVFNFFTYVSELMQIYKYRKNPQSTFTKRWQTINTDPLSWLGFASRVLFVIIAGYLLISLMNDSFALIFLITSLILIFLFIGYGFIQNRHMSLFKKRVSYTLIMFIAMYVMFGTIIVLVSNGTFSQTRKPTLNGFTSNNLETLIDAKGCSTYNDTSFVAKDLDIICEGEHIRIVRVSVSMLEPTIMKSFMRSHFVTPVTMEVGTVKELNVRDNPDYNLKHFYKGTDFMISSDNPIPEQLINEISGGKQ